MIHSSSDRVLTFAGLLQALTLVRRTATEGKRLDRDVETCISSLFVINADTVEDIYQSRVHLRLGLETLVGQLSPDPSHRDTNITRYALTMLHLEKKLAGNKVLLQIMEKGIETAQTQSEFFPDSKETTIASLADLYLQTVSTLPPKILVVGDHTLLQDPNNANLIRTLLLAGMRSAMAWRQCGGTRLQLLFKRSAYLSEAQAILANLPSIDTLI